MIPAEILWISFLHTIVGFFAGYLPVSEGGPVVTTYGGGHVSSLNATVDSLTAVAAVTAVTSTPDTNPPHHHQPGLATNAIFFCFL